MTCDSRSLYQHGFPDEVTVSVTVIVTVIVTDSGANSEGASVRVCE